MKFSLATAAVALATGASASIISIQVPKTITAGKIPVKLVNNIDQSSTYQIGITFGLGTGSSDPPNIIGTPVASIFLQDGTMPNAPFTRYIDLPDWAAGTTEGTVVLRASVFGVYGVMGYPSSGVYGGANVTIGHKISDETGATGYIGGTVLDYVYRAHPDYEYTIYVRNEERAKPIKAKYPKVNFAYGSLEDSDTLTDAVSKTDVVIRTYFVPRRSMGLTSSRHGRLVGQCSGSKGHCQGPGEGPHSGEPWLLDSPLRHFDPHLVRPAARPRGRAAAARADLPRH
ncbi:hypothetical protein NLG97_g7856 [Lecanicillium saksenae]|uniref:Uncharacterized protein n=1 Tax=Lecanicillium saksenae TaxID=468837 RepID=A0ACC1QMB1_9HYPO|nr:hypothetical protein NLG97_g7856 [Lecanicillium saksenae]